VDRLSAEDWPLVGRAGTIDAVSRIIRAGERAGVIMVGHPGVGRTRLARAALAAAVSASPQSRSWVPGWVAASRSTASIPLGALAHLLPDLELGDGSTGRLLIEACGESPRGRGSCWPSTTRTCSTRPPRCS